MNDAISNVEPLFDLSSLNLLDLTESFSSTKQTENSDGEKFVVFFLDDEIFAVSARQVAEVVRPLPFTPLPNSPEWLHGIANLRGAIISVFNLSKLFKKRIAPASLKSRLIVLKPTEFAASIAFLVDRLSEMITLTEKDIRPAEDFRFFGKAVYETSSVNILDTEKLFSSLL